MKYIVMLGDGMADRPLRELKGKTPLMKAHNIQSARIEEWKQNLHIWMPRLLLRAVLPSEDRLPGRFPVCGLPPISRLNEGDPGSNRHRSS